MLNYCARNRKKTNATKAARKRRVRQATPPWANLSAIEAIYLGCPPGHEVDHVVPLKGRTVSGLHVETNLQYLPMPENRKKGAQFSLVA